ncbi:hypothetical protein KFE98_13025 [bacterium SCSIO 12741]|nr:hypothetical protein KFE98_13025 [bacterium SCSIO 12741]
MELRKWLVGLIFLILASLPVISIVVWYFSPEYPINILVIDKTVLTEEGNEHRSFNWILKHHKFVKPSNEFYEVSDYLGFFPLDSDQYYISDLELMEPETLDSLADTLDMMYYTDSYGVYSNEWYHYREVSDHVKLIYGRTSEQDYQLLERMHERQKLIMMEFNTIASPTNYKIRKKIEDEFGILWSGWIGRYFFSLDTNKNKELPRWIIRLYLEQNEGDWPYKDAGIVMVHESDKIVILEKENDLIHEVPIINTDVYYREFFDVPQYIRYPFWFDISYLQYDDLVVSTFKIHTNHRGDSILKANKIPKEFPAVLGDHIINRFYYFAGDFADNPIPFTAVYSRGIENLDFFLYNNRDLSDRKKFFWRYYRPMVSKIMHDYYKMLHFDEYEDDFEDDL